LATYALLRIAWHRDSAPGFPADLDHHLNLILHTGLPDSMDPELWPPEADEESPATQ